VEAKRSLVSSVSQIPYWIYIALVVLGWNEAMTVLFNPVYFVTLLAIVAASYVIISLNLAGPILQITSTVTGEVQRQAHMRLKEYFAEPAASAAEERDGIRRRKPENIQMEPM